MISRKNHSTRTDSKNMTIPRVRHFHLYKYMKYEKSCGVVTYILINNEIHYLLVKQTNGFVSFPKGHVENNETEEEIALRECLGHRM